MESAVCEDLCVAVAGVPKTVSKEDLFKCVSDRSDASVVKWTTVDGAENDGNLERLLLKLDSKSGVTRLYEDVKHEEIEVDGECYTIYFEKCIRCEIPLDWLELEMDGDSDPHLGNTSQGHTNPKHQQTGPGGFQGFMHQFTQDGTLPTFYQNTDNPAYSGQGQGHYQPFMSQGQRQEAAQRVPQGVPPRGVPQGVPHFPQNFNPMQFPPNFRFPYAFPMPQPGGQQQVDGQNMEQGSQPGHQPMYFDPRQYMAPPPYSSGGPDMCEPTYQMSQESATNVKQRVEEKDEMVEECGVDVDDVTLASTTLSDECVLDVGHDSAGNDSDSSVDSDDTPSLGIDIIVHYKVKVKKTLVDFKKPLHIPLLMEKYLKWQYIINNSSVLQQIVLGLKSIAENVKNINGTLEIFLGRQKQAESFDRLRKEVEEIIFSDSDSLVISWFPLKGSCAGEDTYEALNKILQQNGLSQDFYVELVEKHLLRCVHDAKNWDKAAKMINKAIMKFEQEARSNFKTKKVELLIVYRQIFECFKMKEQAENLFPNVYIFFDISETREEFVVYLRGPQRDVDQLDSWMQETFVNQYYCKEFCFNEVEMFEEPIDVGKVIKETLMRENFTGLYWEINRFSRKVWICSLRNMDTNKAVEIAKKCVKKSSNNMKGMGKQVDETEAVVKELSDSWKSLVGKYVAIRVIADHNDLVIDTSGEDGHVQKLGAWVNSYKQEHSPPDTPNTVAQRVVDKGQHTLNKRALEVSLWRSGTGKDRAIKREASLEPVYTVEVQGISHSIDEETLEMYFENEKRSGGGDIQGSEVDYDEGLAYITFKEEAVAERVVDRGNHFINRKPLTVSLYCPTSETPLPREPEHEPQRTVEVQGIGPSIDEETLEMYFENENRSGGGDIDQTDLDQNEGVALITFFSEEVAMRVVQKGNHFLNKKPLTVTIHMKQTEKPAPGKRGTIQKSKAQADSVESDEEEQKPTAVVKVKGVKRVKSLETMRYYFENHRRSDGGDITDLSRHEEDEDVVFITFEEAEVAKRVANRQHSVVNTELQVSLHTPPRPRPVYNDKILIRGLQTSTTKDCLFNFLEAKSGSVPIEWQRGEKEGVVLVTFDSQPDFRKLVEICNKTALEGGMLQVTQVQVTNCIIALNIPDNTTQGTVWYYFENTQRSNGGPIDKVIMREDEGSCLVYFMDYKGFKCWEWVNSLPSAKLVEICNKTALEGGMLQVTQVQVTNCIIALNIPDNTTQDTVWYYFENTRRTNGGPIDKVIMREDEGSCLVYFMDYKDKVVAKTHVLGGQTLIVKIFLDCLGCPQGNSIEMPFKLPDSILISELDAKKIEFMRNSKVNQEAIATQMRDVHAEIKWPEVTHRDVIIECTLTKDMKDARKLSKSWKTTALTNFEDFMKKVVVETLSVVPEQWNPIMDNVKNLHIKNPDAVAVLADREQGHIVVSGLKQIVEGVAKDIAGIIKQVEDDAEKEKQKTKETMTSLPLIQTKMLLAEKFPNTMEKKFPELKVNINQIKNEIVFDGLQGDIRAAKLQMYEIIDKYATISVDLTGCKFQFSLYDSKPAKDYIVRKLKNNHVTAVWEVKDQTLTVCSTGRDTILKSLELIKNSVVAHSVILTKENRDLVQSENWEAMLDKQKQKYPGKTDVEVQGTVSFVCGTDDCVQDVLGAVKKFLKKNTIIEEHVNFSKPINRLIEKNHKAEIEEISKKSASLHAQVVTKSDNAGFTLRGTTEGVDHIKSELDNLRRRVLSEDHTLTNPGIAGYMKTKGRDHINTVESKHAVVIDDSPNEDDGLYEELPDLPAMDHGNLRIDSECTIYDDRKIYTAEGDMTELNVDVLVNTVDTELNLTGGLGKAIVSKGGNEVLDVCKNYIRDEGELSEGEAFLSPAGKLRAKYIVHAVGPVWKDGTQNEEQLLAKSVLKSMKRATMKNVRSIALPAISCGFHSFPIRRATKVIVQSVKNFFREIQDSTIMTVYLCDVKSATVENFTNALVQEFGNRNVRKMPKVVRPKAAPRNYAKRFLSMFSSLHSDDDSSGDEGPQTSGLGYGQKGKSKQLKKSGKKIKVVQAGTPDQFPIRNEVQKQEFKDPLLKNLPEAQRKPIKALEKEYNVQIRFQGSDRIEVIGLIQNVMDANNKIHSVIRQLDRMEIQKREAVRVSRMVQWFFIDITEVKQELIQYDPAVNMLIENAFSEGKPKVAFRQKDGNKYIIEFDKMHKYPEGDPTDCVNVIRRDRMKDGSFETPKSWNTMGDENLKVVTLQNTDSEFQDIANKFTTSVNSSNFVVTRIDRIQNKPLWMQYQAKKKLLDTTNKTKDNEKLLWHGTTVDSVDSINANGFNRSYCGKNATAFGDGVYFMVNASYSCSDTHSRPDSSGVKRMYLCHVLTGEYTQGKSGMRVPPSKQGGATSSLYDSVANNVSFPTSFIIFYDTQAYPHYLILFKKKS